MITHLPVDLYPAVRNFTIIGESTENDVKEDLAKAHELYKNVFNKDLSSGYNDFYGRHRCELNWSTNERPVARKVRVPNYNHELQGL